MVTSNHLSHLPFNEISSPDLNYNLTTLYFLEQCDSLRMFETIHDFSVYIDNFITLKIILETKRRYYLRWKSEFITPSGGDAIFARFRVFQSIHRQHYLLLRAAFRPLGHSGKWF